LQIHFLAWYYFLFATAFYTTFNYVGSSVYRSTEVWWCSGEVD
jgi:hypothetical protein